MVRSLLGWLGPFGPWDILDMAIVATLIYFVLAWFKQTKTAFVAFGMFILAGVYIMARAFDLVLTAYIFQGFFAVFLVALVVIFQEELRHFFERIGVWSLGGRVPAPLGSSDLEALVRALADFSRQKIGALIVLRGRDPVGRHIAGAVELDGLISEAVLKSIFDPHSEGHDGAVIIGRGRLEQFSARLPLSKEFEMTAHFGTRHAAALGLAELTDALCLIVSEERGSISVAHEGKLEEMRDLGALRERIERFLRETEPGEGRSRWLDYWRVNRREKLSAIVLSVLLWFLFAQGQRTTRREIDVPVIGLHVPQDLVIREISPRIVKATLSGRRRSFYLLDPQRLAAHLDLSEGVAGEQLLIVPSDSLQLPESISVLRVDPPEVRILLSSAAAPGQRTRATR